MPSRVLIADDQPDVIEALRLVLKAEGFDIETARSVAQIASIVETRDLDAVIMDLNYTRDTTSGREGLDLLPRLRELDQTLPIIVMTAWGSVDGAVEAMRNRDSGRFGALLTESHASLRDRLRVSSPALDRLVEAALASGAAGARLTGAGFGGCVVVFASKHQLPSVRRSLIERFYAGRPEFDEKQHLIDAEPGPGALSPEKT